MDQLSQVLDAVNSALTVIRTVANTPGINMIPYVSTISGAIGALQAAYGVGKNLVPYIDAIKNTFGSGATVPTQADLDALDAKMVELEAAVQAPLPPPDEGEPD